jgi:hypothetical protein
MRFPPSESYHTVREKLSCYQYVNVNAGLSTWLLSSITVASACSTKSTEGIAILAPLVGAIVLAKVLPKIATRILDKHTSTPDTLARQTTRVHMANITCCTVSTTGTQLEFWDSKMKSGFVDE